VYATEADSDVVVQGYVVSSGRVGVKVPDGETLVLVPIELLAEAVRSLSGGQHREERLA
jgi:hypothetical protein